MRSPFPGMDPYVEATGVWSTFHHAFLTACHDQLNERLPPDYVAAIEERVLMIDEELEVRRVAEPDVEVIHEPGNRGSRSSHSGVATLEPQTLPQDVEWLDPPHQLYLEVLHMPERQLVTDIELLSPTNKRRGDDRVAYLMKRKGLFRAQVNLVEIDLLLAGERLRMAAPLPAGDYYAFVTRSLASRQCDVFYWSLRDALPTAPVPLRPEDGEVGLDLAAAFGRTYERGRYDRILKYRQPNDFLPERHRQWANERIATGPAF